MTRTNDRTYLRNRARLKKPGVVCVLCGEEIDLTIPWPDLRCFVSDHVIPIAAGGHNRGDLQPMHNRCNRLRSDKPLEEVMPVRHSRAHY